MKHFLEWEKPYLQSISLTKMYEVEKSKFSSEKLGILESTAKKKQKTKNQPTNPVLQNFFV